MKYASVLSMPTNYEQKSNNLLISLANDFRAKTVDVYSVWMKQMFSNRNKVRKASK